MKKKKYVGKSLDEALDNAAKDLGSAKENLSYNIVPSEGGSLFKKLLFKTITIEAWMESSRQDLQEAARKAVSDALGKEARKENPPHDGRKAGASQNHQKSGGQGKEPQSRNRKRKPQRQTRTASNEPVAAQPSERTSKPKRPRAPQVDREPNPNAITFDEPGVRELLEEYTENFLRVFGATRKDADIQSTPEGDVTINVENELLEDLLARSDRLSAAFEHVFKRLTQKKLGDISQRLTLNAGSAHEKRVENLREMARSMAEKVRTSGRSITLNAMSGQERRVIHVTIDELEGVATRSIGAGDGRKLVIYSTEKRRASEDRTNGGDDTNAKPRNGRSRRRFRSRRPREKNFQGESNTEVETAGSPLAESAT